MIQLKEVLNFYLGCEIDTNCTGPYMHPYGAIKYKILDSDNIGSILWQLKQEYSAAYCKPILRRLEDITTNELLDVVGGILMVQPHLVDFELPEVLQWLSKNIAITVGEDDDKQPLYGYEITPALMFELTRYLLSRNFDLFGLIDTGQAIDKKTLKG